MRHRNLAIYDMDKTITRVATWTPFLRHAARERGRGALLLLPIAGAAVAGYALKLYGRDRLKEMTQRLILGRAVPGERLADTARRFAQATVATGLLDGARDRIEADRAEGRMLILATASYRFYAQEIADLLGFDAVIATESVGREDGHVLPRIHGENCYGAAKLRAIRAWVEGNGIARDDVRVRFYSDHVSDAPVFDWADEPFPVNAHAPLKALAKKRGWPILDWRT
ncbi:haloacid dehalogenase [Sphingomonas sp. Leaf407]|uniref:HAD family hydrolase n=1 Tax=unclassified Sphingomonas TaxID=196159 RepID=UPI000701737C|nr:MULTISPECIES: HAD-IB family hydrolase [unclassified Sphingomonas]KQN39480.1 haloacid dehalogenase [Sphingomonas sp. Leaf42]KQT28756.1 haloacid dehalogenase [Sphingomonas sp. Leaf407]